MGDMTLITTIMVLLNVLMWFASLSMTSMNPSGTVCYHLEGSIIEQSVAGSGNGTVLQNNIINDLPGSQGAVSTSGSNNIFTDIFNNILDWFKTAPGVKYIYGVIAAPYNILKCMDLPTEFTVGIGTLWYLVSLLILVAFLWGR